LLFAAFAAIAIWAYNTWGLWGFFGTLLGFVAFFWVLSKMIGAAVKRVFFMPFKMKGAVLKNAVVTVHSVTPAGPPVIDVYDEDEDDEYEEQRLLEDGRGHASDSRSAAYEEIEEEDDEFDEDDEPSEPLDWYHLDVTITPKAAQGPFRLWEPGELALVEASAKGDDFAADDLGHVDGVQVWHEGNWQDDDGSKYLGPQRLRLHAGVVRGARRARLKYYFEILEGEVELPQLAS
jgi:hypothetical protein